MLITFGNAPMTEPSINEREILGAYAPTARRVLVCLAVVVAALSFAGCHDGTPDWCVAEIQQLKTQHADGTRDIHELQARVDKLEQNLARRLGSSANDAALVAAPNIHAALGHALLAASAITGRDQIDKFFRDEVGKIVARRFPVDLGGAIKTKCQDDMAQTINSLMDNP